jgi:hypothetical protein
MRTVFPLLLSALLIAAAPSYGQQKAPTSTFVPPQSEAPRTRQNVHLEVTVTTQEGGKTQVIYQVSGVFGDGGRQELNTGRDMFITAPDGGSYRPAGLSLIAQPTIQGRNVLVAFTIEFTLPASRHPGDKDMPPRVEQEATTILESGKPLTVFTSDSPGLTPRISVELTATILEPGSQPQPSR